VPLNVYFEEHMSPGVILLEWSKYLNFVIFKKLGISVNDGKGFFDNEFVKKN